MIIGLAGYARAGKSTVAQMLADDFGFRQWAFADAVRESLEVLNPIVGVTLKNPIEPLRLNDVIAAYGWEGYKQSYWGQEIRRLMQHMWTEVGRNIIGEDSWVNKMPAHRPMVISDVRMDNEAEAVRNAGGIVVLIERPGVTSLNKHESEKLPDKRFIEHVLVNDGSLGDLREGIHKIMD